MSNITLAKDILQWLSEQGVQQICLCPGGRNAPFVFLLDKNNLFQIHSAFDERSAAFFALGLAQKHQQPVALIVTSGTAVAEALPAVIEAYYTRTPLIVISADRPRQLRGTGAPQTIEQVGIFTNYVENCVDCEGSFSPPEWTQSYSLHLNVCFSEPLLDEELTEIVLQKPRTIPSTVPSHWSQGCVQDSDWKAVLSTWQNFLEKSQTPLLMISGLKPQEQKGVERWLRQWPSWVYIEGTSGIREVSHPWKIQGGERSLKHLFQQKAFDGVLRIGGVPTNRLWRDLENVAMPVLSFSSLPFPGMQRGEHCFFSLNQLIDLPTLRGQQPKESFLQIDQMQKAKWEQLLQDHPRSEASLMRWLSQQIPPEATVYVGNSLPIREWDIFAQTSLPFSVLANRGANGIDGQLSTALANLDPQKELWVILGDLTTLYDANALWFWQKNPQKIKLVVINNQGGKIFERLFQNPLFYNSHQIQFHKWAEQWGLAYQKIEVPQPLITESAVVEICPEATESQKFWQKYDTVWSSFL